MPDGCSPRSHPTGRPTTLTRREKALVVAAAVAPDIDGIGIIPNFLPATPRIRCCGFLSITIRCTLWHLRLVCTLAAYLIAGPLAPARTFATSSYSSDFTFGPAIRKPQPSNRRLPSHPGLTAFLVFISFHLHLLCDLIGARGPDGDQWPIPYLKPFSNTLQLTWHGQWALNAWQNFVITGLLLLATFWIAWRHGSSPLELVSEPANQALTQNTAPTLPPNVSLAIVVQKTRYSTSQNHKNSLNCAIRT